MAPKCGSTTIANMLDVSLHTKPDLSFINNPEYKKIIIIRKNVVERFLSGFYEDLFNNFCYENLNITFNDYLLFLYKCFQQKIPYVDNIKIYNEDNEEYIMPIWCGNCSNKIFPITNYEGVFCAHLQSQKFAINDIVRLIKDKTNVKIIELNDLSKLTNSLKKNEKKKLLKMPDGINDFSELMLSYIKKNRIIINENLLTDKQKEIILDIYNEDIIFINNLEENFSYF
jgi:hypothetical protein